VTSDTTWVAASDECQHRGSGASHEFYREASASHECAILSLDNWTEIDDDETRKFNNTGAWTYIQFV